jgi:hypothetical protein
VVAESPTAKQEDRMIQHDHPGYRDQAQGSFLTSPAGLVLIGFLAIAGLLLFTEHRAHALGALIYVPLLICPLMHFFMHGKHGGHGGQDDRERKAS